MNARSLAVLFAILATFLGWVAPATAQTSTAPVGPVLVYRLSFRPLGGTINFRSYQGGYYVADIANSSGANSGTLILTQASGSTRKYYTLANFGPVIYAIKGNERKAIFTGTKQTTSPAITNITFYALGDTTKTGDFKFINGNAKIAYATKLEGTALFVDSQEDLPFAAAPGADLGTAGSVAVTLTLQEGLTERSRVAFVSRNSMVTILQQELAEQKYTNGDAPTGAVTTTR